MPAATSKGCASAAGEPMEEGGEALGASRAAPGTVREPLVRVRVRVMVRV